MLYVLVDASVQSGMDVFLSSYDVVFCKHLTQRCRSFQLLMENSAAYSMLSRKKWLVGRLGLSLIMRRMLVVSLILGELRYHQFWIAAVV